MPLAPRLSRLALRFFAFSALLAGLLPASTSAAVFGPKAPGPLSPTLAELADPAVAGKSRAGQASHLGVPANGPGSLLRDGGRVLVTARFDGGAIAARDELQEADGDVVSSSRRTQTVTVSVAPARLRALAAVPGVRSIWQVREPISYVEGPCEGGAAISEGVAQLRVDEARETFQLRGKGMTVGVLSDSYDTATATATDAEDDVDSGDLPGPAGTCSDQQLPVNLLDEGPSGSSDEGRAMLQIVHDLAPKAELAFATAFQSEDSFAQNIELLARSKAEGGGGAQVVVDDVAWFEEPFFQDGPIAVAIDNVTDAGVNYFSAAGNDNLFDSLGNEISSWEAPAFRDSGSCPDAIAGLPGFNGTHCMDFDPSGATDSAFGITVEAGETLIVDLQWAEPWNGVTTDLDAFLLSGTGKIVAVSFDENVGSEGTQRPVEIVGWENNAATSKTVFLAVNRFSGGNPRLKFILLQNGGGVSGIEYPESTGGDVVGPSIFGHAGAASTIAVAAVPFNNSAQIEPYSSRGPVTHYFGPVEGTSPAAPLGSPEELAKPDLAATDCGATTFFAFLSAGTWRFCGTSAAAPHAAAVAALVRQAKPTLPEHQVRDALAGTAAPVGAFPPEAAGAGLVDAFAAISSLPGPIEGGDGPSEPVPPVEPPPAPGTAQVIVPLGEAPAPPVPGTTILRHPPKVVRTRAKTPRLVFRFGSDQPGATFFCKVDRNRFRACPSRFVRRYSLGRHVLRVKAKSQAGAVDPTPAVFRFRVKSLG